MGLSDKGTGETMKKLIAIFTSIAMVVFLNLFTDPSKSNALEVKEIEKETACLNELIDVWKEFGTPYPCFPEGTLVSLPVPVQAGDKPSTQVLLELNSNLVSITQNSNRVNIDRYKTGLNKAQFISIDSQGERYSIGEPFWFISYKAKIGARASSTAKKSYVLTEKGPVSIQSLAKPGMNVSQTKITATNNQGVAQEYKTRVYTADLTSEDVRLLTNSGNVELISNTIVYPSVDQLAPNSVDPSVDQLAPPSWGLDRIDQSSLPLNQKYSYLYTGANVNAYIIDSGINTSHQEFTGRILRGAWTSGLSSYVDCNGHGTHVAGTIGGTKYGVAKAVKFIPVRVFGCSGGTSSANVVAAMDWVVTDHVTSTPALVNMSLGGGISTSIDQAVTRLVNDGVVTVVAAGNSGENACNYSPARAPSALTVGSSTNSDLDSTFSNVGSCVDLFAPGSSITSAWIGSTGAAATISGTSMAAPHVAGVAAMILQKDFPSYPNKALANSLVSNTLLSMTAVGKLKACCSSSWYANTPNKLLNISSMNGGRTNITLPKVSGIPRVGQTLSATKGSWSGTPAPVLTYQWVACSSFSDLSTCVSIPNAKALTFLITSTQVGKYLRIVEIANGSESAASLAYPCQGICSP
jgi:subtilisin family serine protease